MRASKEAPSVTPKALTTDSAWMKPCPHAVVSRLHSAVYAVQETVDLKKVTIKQPQSMRRSEQCRTMSGVQEAVDLRVLQTRAKMLQRHNAVHYIIRTHIV